MATDTDARLAGASTGPGNSVLRRVRQAIQSEPQAHLSIPHHPQPYGYGWHAAGTADPSAISFAHEAYGQGIYVTALRVPTIADFAGLRTHSQQPETRPDATWLDPLLAQLDEIAGLAEGWNSYGAARTDAQTAIRAIRLLREAAEPGAPAPSAVPTPSGGVQLEWHERGIDLEIELTPHRQVLMHYADDLSGEDWDEDITHNVPRLTRALTELTSRRP